MGSMCSQNEDLSNGNKKKPLPLTPQQMADADASVEASLIRKYLSFYGKKPGP